MGFARRVVRKSVRKATPRSVRKVIHPVRTAKNAVTPRPVRTVSRAIYTVTNPLGAAENAVIDAVLNVGNGRSSQSSSAVNGRSTVAGPAYFAPSRADIASQSQYQLAQLMSVQRLRFAPIPRPQLALPVESDPSDAVATEWRRRRREVSIWKRQQRKLLKAQVDAGVRAAYQHQHHEAVERAQHQHAETTAWWSALQSGDPRVLSAALITAFADNPAPVSLGPVTSTSAVLLLFLPGTNVLPEKMAHVTPTGRLSSKAWPKSEFNSVYGQLLGAHLLATIREAYAIGPSLNALQIIGVSESSSTDVYFDIAINRASYNYTDDHSGETILSSEPYGFRRTGKAGSILPWPPEQLPAATAALVAECGR